MAKKPPITADQAAEIFGVAVGLFKSCRRGIGAPDPVAKNGQAYLYDPDECRAWAEKNDFWSLGMDYKFSQRHGNIDRSGREIKKRPYYKRKEISNGPPKELTDRYQKSALSPVLVRFLRGEFAPENVKIANDMKLIRARLNKPKTKRVFYPGNGVYSD